MKPYHGERIWRMMKKQSATIDQLVSKLRFKIEPRHRNFQNEGGPEGRIKMMRRTVTALVKHERIETTYYRADESRGYMERLISEALRHGDCHRPTMNLAKFWLEDSALVPKLFKVLVPRYQSWPSGLPYTRMLRGPSNITDYFDNHQLQYPMVVLELRGNPYPALVGPVTKPHPGMLHNVLLEEARKDYFRSQSVLSQNVETEVQALPDEDTCHLEPVKAEDIQELSEDLKTPVGKEDPRPSQPA